MVIKLSTDGFAKHYTLFLKDLLEKAIDGKIYLCKKHPEKEQYFLKLSDEASLKFVKYIDSVFNQLNLPRKNKWVGRDLDNLVKGTHKESINRRVLFYQAIIDNNYIVNQSLFDLDFIKELKLIGINKSEIKLDRCIELSDDVRLFCDKKLKDNLHLQSLI